MRRADRLAVGACRFLSWFAFGVAALTLVPLAARIAGAIGGRSAAGGSTVLAVIVPLLWAAIGVGLRRVARGVAGRSGP